MSSRRNASGVEPSRRSWCRSTEAQLPCTAPAALPLERDLRAFLLAAARGVARGHERDRHCAAHALERLLALRGQLDRDPRGLARLDRVAPAAELHEPVADPLLRGDDDLAGAGLEARPRAGRPDRERAALRPRRLLAQLRAREALAGPRGLQHRDAARLALLADVVPRVGDDRRGDELSPVDEPRALAGQRDVDVRGDAAVDLE